MISLQMRTIIMIMILAGLGACQSADHSASASDQDSDSRELLREEESQRTISPSRVMGIVPGDIAKLTWKDLADVSFEERYYEELGQYLLFPYFGDTIREKAGQEYLISGFVIPVTPGDEENPPLYVLSANPFSACFFCGNAGPESVMELSLADDPYALYATDEFRTFRGILQLNDSDVDRLNYLLLDARVVE